MWKYFIGDVRLNCLKCKMKDINCKFTLKSYPSVFDQSVMADSLKFLVLTKDKVF